MSQRTALVVDDSRSARFALRKYLEGQAFRVETADSAHAAYQVLEQLRPDLIFLDHVMPGEDGIEALRHLKSDPATAAIPVVICSSNEGSSFVAAARSQGAADVLQKPPTAEQLRLILDQIESTGSADEPVTLVEEEANEPAWRTDADTAPAPESVATGRADTPMPPPATHDWRDVFDGLRAELAQLRSDAADLPQVLEARVTAVEARIAAMEQRLAGDLASSRKQHEKANDALRQQLGAEIEALKRQHGKELDALRRQFNQDLAALRGQLTDAMDAAVTQARQQALDQLGDALLLALGRG